MLLFLTLLTNSQLNFHIQCYLVKKLTSDSSLIRCQTHVLFCHIVEQGRLDFLLILFNTREYCVNLYLYILGFVYKSSAAIRNILTITCKVAVHLLKVEVALSSPNYLKLSSHCQEHPPIRAGLSSTRCKEFSILSPRFSPFHGHATY